MGQFANHAFFMSMKEVPYGRGENAIDELLIQCYTMDGII
jgi:hypothetical protein